MRRLTRLLLALALLLAASAAMPASAQIRRCTAADGSAVYTDRKCEEVGAVERTRASTAARGGRVIRRDCSRNLQDLVFELGAAIDNRDVNRLAGIYHWPGTSTRNAYAIMGRLDTIVNRPLVDITPVQPTAPTSVAPAAQDALAWRSPSAVAAVQNPRAAEPPLTTDPDAELPDAVRAVAQRRVNPRRPPVGLLVDQTVSNRIAPIQTVFSLRRHLDCWWVSL